MTRLILEKLKNKRIMTLCLMLGIALLVAAIACQPMYKTGSLNRVLQTQFEEYISSNNMYPVVITRDEIFEMNGDNSFESISAEYDSGNETIRDYFDFLGQVSAQRVVTWEKGARALRGYPDEGIPQYYEKGFSYSVMCVPSYIKDLEEHTKIYDYTDEVAIDGYYPCLVSKSAMDSQKLYVGEALKFDGFVDESGACLQMIISGVFEENDNDLFFYESTDTYKNNLFLTEDNYREITTRFNVPSLRFVDHYLYDYSRMTARNVSDVRHYLNKIAEQFVVTETISAQLNSYDISRKSIDVTLWVMELPLLAMILAFIYMVSKQIVGAELSEIAAYKSRGLSRFQVILMYLYQAAMISGCALVIGIPLGVLMSKLAGSATDFLSFEAGSSWMYRFTLEACVYGLAAALVGIVCVIIPVIGMSRVSIVQVKGDYKMGQKTIWEKCFLDIILLALSLYLLRNFMKNLDGIRMDALLGQMMDPFTFIDTCLFLVTSGMVFIRIIRLLVRFIYRIQKEKCKTYVYVAFLQSIRNYNKQILISLFLVITIGMGIFYSNTARTINNNKIERIKYNIGCDMKVGENWNIITYKDSQSNRNYRFSEPEYGRYEGLTKSGIAESITRVITCNSIVAGNKNKTVDKCMVYGIHTKEFGETATLRAGLNGKTHWFNYLNALSENPKGVIISRNMAEALSLSEGDSITLTKKGEFEAYKDLTKGTLKAQVCAIVDDWPGYERYYYTEEENLEGQLVKVEHEQYLAVMNYSAYVYAYGISPYNVWIKLSDRSDESQVMEYLDKAQIKLSLNERVDENIEKVKNSLDIQIINGMFTLGFIVAVIVCIAGFLIYWITFIRQRELQFGVYRAMGMSSEEIGRMLVVEHELSTLFSIICGLVGGILATLLFETLFCTVYLPEKHNLELYMYYDVKDFVRLGIVIIAMLAACMVVLSGQVRQLKISDALKLGEE